jgi:capsular polysaccharide biosynthesis protein
MVEKEINLSSVLIVIWERGKKIAIITGLFMVFGALGTMLMKERFKSEATLFINLSKIGERTMQFPAVTVETYEKLFYREPMLKEVIDIFALDEKPYNLKNPKDLKNRIDVESMNHISLILVTVELEDADMAAAVANEIARKAQETNQQIRELEAESSIVAIGEAVLPIIDRMNDFRDTYKRILLENTRNVLNTEFNTNLSTLAQYRQEMANVDISIVELEKRLELFETIFSATDFTETITTHKHVTFNPLADNAVEEVIGEADMRKLNQLQLLDEAVNPAFVGLNQEYQKLKVDLPAMIAKREILVKQIQKLDVLVIEQSKQLTEMEIDEMVAKADFDRMLEIFGGIDKQIGWAPTTVITERQDLYILNEAIPIYKKVYPRRSLVVGLVGMISFLLVFMYYLMADLYGLVKMGIPRIE